MQDLKRFLYRCIGIFFLAGWAVSGYAQQPVIQWSSPDSQDGSFGSSIDSYGAYAIVGAPKADGNTSTSGAAYIYRLDNLSSTPVQTLTASDGATDDHFGASVAITDKYAFVGAYGADYADSTDLGKVYVYKLNNGSWVSAQVITVPDTLSAHMQFGYAIAADTGKVLIGAPGTDDYSGVKEIGFTFLYDLKGGKWEYMDNFYRSMPAGHEHYGYDVDIHDTTAVVGMKFYTSHISFPAGIDEAHVFNKSSKWGNWIHDTSLWEENSTYNDKYATAVSVFGNHVLVGAYEDEYTGDDIKGYGVVHVYRQSPDGWVREDSLRPPNRESFEKFGISVDLDNNTAAVGASYDGTAGAAFVYKNVDGTWSMSKRIPNPDPPASQDDSGQFGNVVKLNGSYLLASSYLYHNNTNTSEGSVYVFKDNQFVTAVDKEKMDLPSKITLDPAYPNPFNPSTTLRYALPRASSVRVEVYNTIGRKVETLIDKRQVAGKHQIRWEADELAGGLYFIRIQTPQQQLTQKVTLIK